MTAIDIEMMSLALRQARLGAFTARPNPCVGCVIAHHDHVIATGWHYRAGLAHAEVNALRAAGESARGASAYVTLEPCHHHGRTGPCTEALVAAGIARVVYAMEDANPLVAGKGLAYLRDAGIVVEGPVLYEQAHALNAGFMQRMRTGLPRVRSKVAMSLDGRTAMASGESQWITSQAAREDVQWLRARSCAIVTGIGSILADNSRLSVRLSAQQLLGEHLQGTGQPLHVEQPLRVVVDSHLRIDPNALVFAGEGNVVIATTERALQEQDAKVDTLQQRWPGTAEIVGITENESGRIDLTALLGFLAQVKSCNDVLIEAGASLNGALLAQGLIDELVIYQAPVLLGDSARAMAAWSIDVMADKQSLHITDQRRVGADLRITATLQRSPL